MSVNRKGMKKEGGHGEEVHGWELWTGREASESGLSVGRPDDEEWDLVGG